MNSTHKGNKLEDEFYQYLLDQQSRGELIYGVHSPKNCEIFKKKSYHCRDRGANVEFDVVIEICIEGRSSPTSFVIFECKNHDGNIQETHVRDFSSKIGGIFPHNVKGVMVVSNKLQSGAETFAKNKGIGIAKYDPHGIEIVADRTGSFYAENSFVESQIFQKQSAVKSLRFSAFYNGNFVRTVSELLDILDEENQENRTISKQQSSSSVKYVSPLAIKNCAKETLKLINYAYGAVDLKGVCDVLSIELKFTHQEILDLSGRPVLGSADFFQHSILINAHGNRNRERFTIAHEIGHFRLQHQKYLRSETIVERDLLVNDKNNIELNFERLESQANMFASELLLPDDYFMIKTAEYRKELEYRNSGHGYIYVDNQPDNIQSYDELTSKLSEHFEVSKQAIEIKFRKMDWLNDRRAKSADMLIANSLGSLIRF